MKIVVYTAIFGAYDGLLPQPKQSGVDYFCFTNQAFKSKTWRIVSQKPPVADDFVKSARYYKLNPHLLFKDYDVSIWIDGNMLIIGDIQQLIQHHLNENTPMLVFDHNQCDDARNTVQEELNRLIELVNEGTKQASISTMQEQVARYAKNGFKDDCGLITSGVLIRKHHHPKVIAAMELWWQEVKKYSHRDQLSFNYAAWKTNLNYSYLPGDLRNGNPWFHMIGRHRSNYRGKWFRYQLKQLIGLK